MLKLENSKLGMELVGFEPLEFFSPEQVKLMRSMTVEPSIGIRRFKKDWTTLTVKKETRDNLQDEFLKSGFKIKQLFVDNIIQLGIKTYEAIK
jgi:hypothetical protein